MKTIDKKLRWMLLLALTLPIGASCIDLHKDKASPDTMLSVPSGGANAATTDGGRSTVEAGGSHACCPGDTVAEAEIARRGVDAYFSVSEISDDVFRRMRGKSYKEGCRVARADLRYLRCLHTDTAGRSIVGEMVVNKAIADDVLAILRELYAARYPIERMRLIDDYGADDERSMAANNSSAFNYRAVTGSAKLSAHSRGMAVDINPLYNPCRRTLRGRMVVEPLAGKRYVDRRASFSYKIVRGDLCHRLFTEHGFLWGGDWRTVKDYQHFEVKR